MNAEERMQKFMSKMEDAVVSGKADDFESYVSVELAQAFRECGDERIEDAAMLAIRNRFTGVAALIRELKEVQDKS